MKSDLLSTEDQEIMVEINKEIYGGSWFKFRSFLKKRIEDTKGRLTLKPIQVKMLPRDLRFVEFQIQKRRDRK